MDVVVLGRLLMLASGPVGLALLAVGFFTDAPTGIAGFSMLMLGFGWLMARSSLTPEAKLSREVAPFLGWTPFSDVEAEAAVPSATYPMSPVKLQRQGLIAGKWQDRDAKRLLLDTEFSVEVIALDRRMPRLQLVPRALKPKLELRDTADMQSTLDNVGDSWVVWCEDVDFARTVLASDRVRYVLDSALDYGMGITIDGDAIYGWSTENTSPWHRVAERLDMLVLMIEAIPRDAWSRFAIIEMTVASAAPMPGIISRAGTTTATPPPTRSALATEELKGGREKNYLARVSVLLSFTCYGAPFAVLMGWFALRAHRGGLANNARTARVGIVLGVVNTVLFAALMVALFTGALDQ